MRVGKLEGKSKKNCSKQSHNVMMFENVYIVSKVVATALDCDLGSNCANWWDLSSNVDADHT